MKRNKFELEAENKIESLPVIGDFIAASLSQLNIRPPIGRHVQLAVDEACTNVIHYAYEGTGIIRITVELASGELIVTVDDQGKPFNPLEVPPPDLDSGAEDRPIGGLGIHLIKNLMNQVSYSYDVASGNRLTMKKRVV